MNDSLIGKTIGGYHVLEEIGQGGMATVYRAHQISMDRDVAIKIMPPQFLRESVSMERFKREASIVARLEHRAIVPVHDYGEHEGIPYIVMRYMDSGSAEDLLQQGALSPDRTMQILLQIAPALDYAHRAGVLHRDLKPSNILLDANGDAYITDFGIARLLGDDVKSLTTSGVVGTPAYMSPEQAQGHALDGRSDLYALGVVLFELLTGVRPFDGETPYSVAVKHVTEAPPSPCHINPSLPRSIEPVLLKTLAKKPDHRYATANEVAEALRQAVEEAAHPSLFDDDSQAATEPSLNEALRSDSADRWYANVDTSPVVLPQAGPPPPASVVPPRSAPDLQVMPPYSPPPSRAYTGPLVSMSGRPLRRTNRPRQWLPGALVVLLAGGMLLAVMLVGVYYVLDTGESPGPTSPTPNYQATGMFKLTATKEGLLTQAPDMATTPIPTNTLRPETVPDAALDVTGGPDESGLSAE